MNQLIIMIVMLMVGVLTEIRQIVKGKKILLHFVFFSYTHRVFISFILFLCPLLSLYITRLPFFAINRTTGPYKTIYRD